jgi:hypothetical protein
MVWRKSHDADAADAMLARAADYAEPLVAWRLWEIEDLEETARLRSLYRICFWPVGRPFEARCEAHRFRLRRRARHSTPAATCTCGVYGVPFAYVRKLAVNDRLLPPGRPLVLGTVSLWGEVVECERGWRAALAYPDRLFMPLEFANVEHKATGLEDYGVPVELLDTNRLVQALDSVGTGAGRAA